MRLPPGRECATLVRSSSPSKGSTNAAATPAERAQNAASLMSPSPTRGKSRPPLNSPSVTTQIPRTIPPISAESRCVQSSATAEARNNQRELPPPFPRTTSRPSTRKGGISTKAPSSARARR